MSNLNDEKIENREAASQNPPPYSEKQPPYDYPEPPKSFVLPAQPVDHRAAPPMPNQYQVYYGPPGEGSSQIPVLQAPQAIFITTVQPTHEPDYLVYSIFTTLCCFPILGVAALIFSIQAHQTLAYIESDHLAHLDQFCSCGLAETEAEEPMVPMEEALAPVTMVEAKNPELKIPSTNQHFWSMNLLPA
ncbi:Katanin p80 WD40 repeat-containing subunit B1 [Varanus komodoensis]|nr:Katanin p80 WD40 repeat-containing subunit B1 [Varanus komodoensis]